MSKRTHLILPVALLFGALLNQPVSAQQNLASAAPKNSQPSPAPAAATEDNERIRDGLTGPVRRIRTETSKLSNRGGKYVEDKRVVLETAAYDIKGAKTETAYFPVAGATLNGKEMYKYDDKGNISEMTLLNPDGSLLSKEAYTYEYDFVGNWTKMTTSVAVIEGGKLSFEPTEVTYRMISYYLDANLAKMMQPAQPSAATINAAGGAVSTPNAESSKTAAKPAAADAANAAPPNNQPAAGTLPSARPPSGAAGIDKVNTAAVTNNAAASGAAGGKPVVVMDVEPQVRLMPKPILKPVSGGVLNGAAKSLPTPSYPDVARRAGAQGAVTVEVVIDETGRVISAKAVNGNTMLQQAAVQAAKNARFSPTMLTGQPVKVSGVITYNFSLNR